MACSVQKGKAGGEERRVEVVGRGGGEGTLGEPRKASPDEVLGGEDGGRGNMTGGGDDSEGAKGV